MSMQKLRGITKAGTYTAQRSMLEHFLLLEEIILREKPSSIDIPTVRMLLAQHLKKYKEQHHIHRPFEIEDIQHYLLRTTEQKISWEKSLMRGVYTSTLIEQVEGDEPITIDMERKEIDHLLLAINTSRPITIHNTQGNYTGAEAGSRQGNANLTITNTEGDWTGAYAGTENGKAQVIINDTNGFGTGTYAGTHQGTAHVIINNTTGDYTGAWAGRDHGKARITINNTKGNYTGAQAGENGTAYLTINNTKGDRTGIHAGKNHGNTYIIITNTEGDWSGAQAGHNGNAIIIGYNNKGKEKFLEHKGTIINYNPDETPRIERVPEKQRTDIFNLIAQNALPEEIMAYLRGNT